MRSEVNVKNTPDKYMYVLTKTNHLQYQEEERKDWYMYIPV